MYTVYTIFEIFFGLIENTSSARQEGPGKRQKTGRSVSDGDLLLRDVWRGMFGLRRVSHAESCLCHGGLAACDFSAGAFLAHLPQLFEHHQKTFRHAEQMVPLVGGGQYGSHISQTYVVAFQILAFRDLRSASCIPHAFLKSQVDRVEFGWIDT